MKSLFKLGIISVLLSSSLAFAGGFKAKSSSFVAGKFLTSNQVANVFGCKGANKSPQVKWSNAPKGTKAFAITIHDPDAPTISGWWHWLAFNIPANVSHLNENASAAKKLPKGTVESVTDFGKSGFGGACPPKGDKAHRYNLTVYALKKALPLNKNAPAGMVSYYLNSMALAKVTIQAKYKR